MGSSIDGKSILYMFNKGYDAARYNWVDKYWYEDDVYKTSHPILEDNPDNGKTGQQGKLSPTTSDDEGYLASKTYL